MRLFKYRDLSNPSTVDEELSRLQTIVANSAFWCARPDTLNDPEELNFHLDCNPTRATQALLAKILEKNRPQPHGEAMQSARRVIVAGRLGDLAAPVINETLATIRATTGIISFATTNNNDTMWIRYGGSGAGVCVELEIPNEQILPAMRIVEYTDDRNLHIDQLFRASLGMIDSLARVFKAIYLTKSTAWASEQEFRFVSTQHSVWHHITPSWVVCVHFGNRLEASVSKRIEDMIHPFVSDEVQS